MTRKKRPESKTKDGLSRRGVMGGAALAVGAGALATNGMLPTASVRAETKSNEVGPAISMSTTAFGLAGNRVSFGLLVCRQCVR